MKLEAELIVTEIEDECLLGLDILMMREEGPAEIKLAGGEIVMNGTVIPCIRIGNGSKIEKVPRGIRGEKSNKDMASSRNLVSTIGALASPKMGDGTRCPEG